VKIASASRPNASPTAFRSAAVAPKASPVTTPRAAARRAGTRRPANNAAMTSNSATPAAAADGPSSGLTPLPDGRASARNTPRLATDTAAHTSSGRVMRRRSSHAPSGSAKSGLVTSNGCTMASCRPSTRKRATRIRWRQQPGPPATTAAAAARRKPVRPPSRLKRSASAAASHTSMSTQGILWLIAQVRTRSAAAIAAGFPPCTTRPIRKIRAGPPPRRAALAPSMSSAHSR